MSAPAARTATAITPARRAAFEVLRRTFEHEAWADRALGSAAERHDLDPRERALAQRLAYGAVRRRGTSDHFAAQLGERPVGRLDGAVLAALRLGLYELLFDRSAPHAAVSQAVELAKGGARQQPRRARARAGFVNALLRRAERDRVELVASLSDADPAEAALAHSVPQWIAELWWEELGPDAARSMLAAINRPAETALRANLLRTDREAALARLGDGFAPPPPPLSPPEAIVVTGPLGEEAMAMLGEGILVAQSRASQGVVWWLDPQPGDRVLDLCAGPGVKTTQIAARLRGRGEIVSVERDPRRAAQIEDLCARTAASGVAVEVADATEVDVGAGYDRVLVDPPCTDLGALASRPDARWRKRAEQPERLAEIQGAILRRGLAALRPGGTLVYSTCTISARESEQVVARALAHQPGLGADDLGAVVPELSSPHDGRFLQTRPDRDGTDGFFVARIRREGRG